MYVHLCVSDKDVYLSVSDKDVYVYVSVSDKDVYVYRSREGEVMEHNVKLNKSTIIMDNSTFVSDNLICDSNSNSSNTDQDRVTEQI